MRSNVVETGPTGRELASSPRNLRLRRRGPLRLHERRLGSIASACGTVRPLSQVPRTRRSPPGLRPDAAASPLTGLDL